MSALVDSIKTIFVSAINDTIQHQANEASATNGNFWIAIASVIIGIASTWGMLTCSAVSGRESKRQQDQMIQALQQQNAHLAEPMAGQKLPYAAFVAFSG